MDPTQCANGYMSQVVESNSQLTDTLDTNKNNERQENVNRLGIQTLMLNAAQGFSESLFSMGTSMHNQVNNLYEGLVGGIFDLNSKVYQEAMAFARSELKLHPDAKPEDIRGLSPVNPEISLLISLYWDKYREKFSEAIKANPIDTWNQKAVLDAADRLMKIAYAISVLTLEDLPRFIVQKSFCTYARALTRQDSYQYRTFFYVTQVYHYLRSALNSQQSGDDVKYVYPEQIPTEHAQQFYKPGTIQNTWNLLYNDYCNRVRMYVSESNLRLADTRHVSWTRKDTGEASFRPIPDTLPT